MKVNDLNRYAEFCFGSGFFISIPRNRRGVCAYLMSANMIPIIDYPYEPHCIGLQRKSGSLLHSFMWLISTMSSRELIGRITNDRPTDLALYCDIYLHSLRVAAFVAMAMGSGCLAELRIFPLSFVSYLCTFPYFLISHQWLSADRTYIRALVSMGKCISPKLSGCVGERNEFLLW